MQSLTQISNISLQGFLIEEEDMLSPTTEEEDQVSPTSEEDVMDDLSPFISTEKKQAHFMEIFIQ